MNLADMVEKGRAEAKKELEDRLSSLAASRCTTFKNLAEKGHQDYIDSSLAAKDIYNEFFPRVDCSLLSKVEITLLGNTIWCRVKSTGVIFDWKSPAVIKEILDSAAVKPSYIPSPAPVPVYAPASIPMKFEEKKDKVNFDL